jgi:hypothetical protein
MFMNSGFNPTDHVRNSALVNALCEILWQAGGSKSAKVVMYVPRTFGGYLVMLPW